MLTNLKIDAIVAPEAGEKDILGPVYRAPQLHVVGSAVEMVQGGGGGSGSDCRYYYYFQSGPYGC